MAPPAQDRTGEVLTVTKFIWDIQTGKVPDDFKSKLRIYEHPSQRSLSFTDLSDYVSRCPLKGIDLPYAVPPVLGSGAMAVRHGE